MEPIRGLFTYSGTFIFLKPFLGFQVNGKTSNDLLEFKMQAVCPGGLIRLLWSEEPSSLQLTTLSSGLLC